MGRRPGEETVRGQEQRIRWVDWRAYEVIGLMVNVVLRRAG
jgi:hypothetical protein